MAFGENVALQAKAPQVLSGNRTNGRCRAMAQGSYIESSGKKPFKEKI